MANEITMSGHLLYAKGNSSIELKTNQLQVDVSGTNFVHHRQSIGTSEEALVLGEVTTLGFMIVINRDATNFVELRPATGGVDLIKLKAGEMAMFRWADGVSAPYALADTGACEIEYILLEN